MIKKIVKSALSNYVNFILSENRKDAEITRMLTARQLINSFDYSKIYPALSDVEFKVFSQWGDDGIIQYLIRKIDVKNKVFIEFGVENYVESNTRFLLMNNNWQGLIIDGSTDNISYIKRDTIYWRHDLKAMSAFVTAENINDLILSAQIKGNIGLLHIDIDGNDYWIWKNVLAVDADIVIVEYNSTFGHERAITIPYRPDFYRSEAHYSNLYFGCSLAALCDLAEEKGYNFVGCNSAGNNAYFIKKNKSGQIPVLTAKEGFVNAQFRESRNEKGELTFLSGKDKQMSIKGLEVINTRTGQYETF